MRQYDFIVIGSGCGLNIVDEAISHGLKVALVDKGPAGGTCLNVGCVPSKMLIHTADRILEAQEAIKLGLRIKVKAIDFQIIMERMRKFVTKSSEHVRKGLKQRKLLDYFEGEGRFTRDFALEVNGDTLTGKRIFLASGSRPFIPTIKGLDKVNYLTNETILKLTALPESLILIGGGYIAVEFGHFCAAMGSKVTMLEMAERLVLSEEPEIAALLKKQLSKRMEVYTNHLVQEVRSTEDDSIIVSAMDKVTGLVKEFTARKILVAVGRKSNADLLRVQNTGVELDERGFIKVNEYLETSRKGIFAIGDANGQQMFTHVANKEAMLAVDNVLHRKRQKMDYSALPHAVYSHPQIASVGLSEEKARAKHKVLVGKSKYYNVAYGVAMLEKEGFAKAIVEQDTGRILGFHIIGPYAPILIQEVINAMSSKGNVDEIFNSMHIHPALTELIPYTLSSA